ncbi:two-component system sensor histidine kinase CreC [Pseudoxanthomonas kalamensis DSM 18571]|uniref:two-component system sensor histidine kinase CreC n=1 Tax=Pseudoxanthomonas kalamensis TaxID=289483 RepID=UPI001390A44E|nr:two-component system sensor histidine kinase CreC [Pseudoxanthomonas kalamensis]KAF1710415.1 two-component system sensor histidine kinase CreC [Pseudoxanthomonas kalamensis DSM 18571]
MRLGLRLFLGFFLIVGLAAFFVMRVFVAEVKPGVRQAIESTLVDTANVLAEMAAQDLAAGRIADGAFAAEVQAAQARRLGAHVWRFPKDSVDFRVTVTDAQGIVVFDSEGRDLGRDNSRWNDVYRTLRGEYGARSSPERPGDDSETVMHVAAPIYAPDDPERLIGVLTVAQPNRAYEPFIVASQRQILRQGAWLIGLSALIGLAVTFWLMWRINRLTRYAQAVSAGTPAPPPPQGRDQIGQLGRALEAMRTKLEGKAYVEQYVQSLTHEMKSPLAAIRGAAELLQEPLPEAERQRFTRSIQDQEQRLTETIDKLLALAEVEQHGWLQKRERVDVGSLLAQLSAQAAPRLQAAGLRLSLTPPPSALAVQGDPYLLRQALSNLLDNAIAFSPQGGEIGIDVQVAGDQLTIAVRDHGPGVPDYALERVFERFYSLARPGSGQRSSGLGLPFVREVARLHGGSVALRNHPEGGAQAELQLPLA